jgi:hypothetical protein
MYVLYGRFFKHFLLLLCINQMASGLFRLMGALGRNIIVANTFGSFALLAVLALGGFVLSRGEQMIQFTLCNKSSLLLGSLLQKLVLKNYVLLHQTIYRNGGCGVTGSHQ